MAGFLARLGKTDMANSYIQKARDRHENDPRTIARCGEVLMMLGRREEAESLLAQAIAGGFPSHALKGKPGLAVMTERDWARVAR